MGLKSDEIIARGHDYATQGRQAADSIFDKKRTWVLVLVIACVSFMAGAVIS